MILKYTPLPLIKVHLDRNVMEESVLEEAEFYNVTGKKSEPMKSTK